MSHGPLICLVVCSCKDIHIQKFFKVSQIFNFSPSQGYMYSKIFDFSRTSGFREEVTELDLDVKQVKINQGSSFEQSRASAILFLGRYLQGFYHTWSWQTSWLCDLDHLNKLSFLHAKKASYKIWLQITQQFFCLFFLKKQVLICDI